MALMAEQAKQVVEQVEQPAYPACSEAMRAYFNSLTEELTKAYHTAREARARGIDPELDVEIPIAPDVASRVEALVGPPGIAKAIRELTTQGLDGATIAFALARRICANEWNTIQGSPLEEKNAARLIEQAVRTSLAIYTQGVITAPLEGEGVSKVLIKTNPDGSPHVAIYYAGPIRAAGGTAACFPLLVAEMCRQQLGLKEWRPAPGTAERFIEELALYAARARVGQYTPREEEIRHIVANCPIEINGEPSEDYEVAAWRDVEGIETPRVRAGVCLVISEGLCLKAAKLLRLAKEAGLDWSWLQPLVRSTRIEAQRVELAPVTNYIDELAAGRPILSHPLASGGFRLRYGRTRFTGLLAKAIHPATMALLDDFLAIGTQIKPERPGKAATVTSCGAIDGPIVKLRDGSVRRVVDFDEALRLRSDVVEILYLGDLLVCYGDWLRLAHPLPPSPWCEEWLSLLLEERGVKRSVEQLRGISWGEAYNLAKSTSTPLAPRWCFFWSQIGLEGVRRLAEWVVDKGCLGYKWFEVDTLKIALTDSAQKPLDTSSGGSVSCSGGERERFASVGERCLDGKRLLELLGVEHSVERNEDGKLFTVLSRENALALLTTLGLLHGKALSIKRFTEAWARARKRLDERLAQIECVREKPKSDKESNKEGDEGNTGSASSAERAGSADSAGSAGGEGSTGRAGSVEGSEGGGFAEERKDEGRMAEKRRAEERRVLFELLSELAGVEVRDTATFFIGAAMGRPEKARERRMNPPVHVLFPIGLHGGRMRNLLEAGNTSSTGSTGSTSIGAGTGAQAAQGAGTGTGGASGAGVGSVGWGAGIELDVAYRLCIKCSKLSFETLCPSCREHTLLCRRCDSCGATSLAKIEEPDTLPCACGGTTRTHSMQRIPITQTLEAAQRAAQNPVAVGTKAAERVKGVIGLISAHKVPEHLAKGFLRARHNLTVFRDGTIRFDATELPVTHFKPSEVGTPIERLRELGYNVDIEGKQLQSGEQLLELRHQDIIIPKEAAEHLLRVAAFVDEELENLYTLPPFHRARSQSDLVGQLVLVIAPHTSAGVLARIIGVSDVRALLAHPYLHCAVRRNCDGDECAIVLLLDALLNFSKAYLPATRGGRMDAPLVLTAVVDPLEVDDEVYSMDRAPRYDQSFYEATWRFAQPSEVGVETFRSHLGKATQFEGVAFTHNADLIGPRKSRYVEASTMAEKVQREITLMQKLRGVETSDAVERILLSHFLPDLYGNLRSFGRQAFRCVDCNTRHRRPPLSGVCSRCGGKLLATVSRGGIEKYLRLSKELIERFGLPLYLRQRVALIEKELESIFEDEQSKQHRLEEYLT